MNEDQLTAQVLGLGQRLDDLVARIGQGTYPGLDGNNYGPGPVTRRCTSSTAFNGSVQQPIPGLSADLDVDDYIFEAWVTLVGDSASAVSAYITMAGTASYSAFKAKIVYMMGAAGTTNRQQTALGNNSGMGSANLADGGTYEVLIHGHITVTAAGTLLVVGAASGSVSPDAFTVQNGSDLRVWLDR